MGTTELLLNNLLQKEDYTMAITEITAIEQVVEEIKAGKRKMFAQKEVGTWEFNAWLLEAIRMYRLKHRPSERELEGISSLAVLSKDVHLYGICRIGDGAYLEACTLGIGVKIGAGVCIGKNTVIEDAVMVGYRTAEQYLEPWGKPVVNLVFDSKKEEGEPMPVFPTIIGTNVRINTGSAIGPSVCIGDNVIVERDTCIEASMPVFFDGSYINNGIIPSNTLVRLNRPKGELFVSSTN